MIGELKENFDGLKLPTAQEVMSVFFYNHKVLSLTIKKSAKNTRDLVKKKWFQAKIPTCGPDYVVKKIIKLHTFWTNLFKNRNRRKSVSQRKKESNFTKELKKLFDITKSGAEKFLDNDKTLFLNSQRTSNRYGFIDESELINSSEEKENDAMDVAEIGKHFFYR